MLPHELLMLLQKSLNLSLLAQQKLMLRSRR
jgi:hypothetical protein